MQFLFMCASQATGDDFSAAISAAVTRSVCQEVRSVATRACASQSTTRADWAKIVDAILDRMGGKRFFALARKEWEGLTQGSQEHLSNYYARASGWNEGYLYTARLLDRGRTEEDEVEFAIRWIKGLLPGLRLGVGLAAGENPTLEKAYEVARRSADFEPSDHTLKRKADELDSRMRKRAATISKDEVVCMIQPELESLRNQLRTEMVPPINHVGYIPFPPSGPPPTGIPAPPPPQQLAQGLPPPPSPSVRISKIPWADQACGFHYSGKHGCNKGASCAKSHNVPENELPPKNCCFAHYYGSCKRKDCKWPHVVQHSSLN